VNYLIIPCSARSHLDIDGRRLSFGWAKQPAKRAKPAYASYPEDARLECWFCLGAPTCETHLVASVGDSAYVAQPKGALVPEHALIVPISHVPTTGVAPDVATYKAALFRCFRDSLDATGVAFERFAPTTKKGVYHAHVQVVPVRRRSAADIVEAFQTAAQRAGFELQTEGKRRDEPADDDASSAYFVVDIASSGTTTTTLRNRGARVPLHFGRQVLAELLGTPAKAHWKACELGKDDERALCAAFKDLFLPFDPFAAAPAAASADSEAAAVKDPTTSSEAPPASS